MLDITCEDRYEAQKLASLIFIRDCGETYITSILNVVGNEIVISLKDGSAHSILLGGSADAERFADFVQSVLDGRHRITSTKAIGRRVEIAKDA